MNQIENGLEAASSTADSASTVALNVNTKVGELSSLNANTVSNRSSIVEAINAVANRTNQSALDIS